MTASSTPARMAAAVDLDRMAAVSGKQVLRRRPVLLPELDLVDRRPGAHRLVRHDAGFQWWAVVAGLQRQHGARLPVPDAGTVRFAAISTEALPCPERLRPLDVAILAVLRAEVAYDIDGDELALTHPGRPQPPPRFRDWLRIGHSVAAGTPPGGAMHAGTRAVVRLAVAVVATALVAVSPAPRSAGAPPATPSRGHAVDLGTFRGGIFSHARDINDVGFVVGVSNYPPTQANHAFIWHPVLGMRDLGTLGGLHATAAAVNRWTYVAGCSTTPDGVSHPYVWSPVTRRMRALGSLKAGGNACASDLNDHGQLTGSSETASGNGHAFFWSARTGMVDVGALDDAFSSSTGINNRGTIAGYAGFRGGSRAFVWTRRTGIRDLGTLGGDDSQALAINDRDEVTGAAQTRDGRTHAFLWSPRTGMRDLGALGPRSSFGTAISPAGAVGGYTGSEGSGEQRAFVWTPREGMRDLGTLGGSRSAVTVMSRRFAGGWATTSDGAQHAFVWSSTTGMRDLGSVGGGHASPVAMNAAGLMAGFSAVPEQHLHATLWIP